MYKIIILAVFVLMSTSCIRINTVSDPGFKTDAPVIRNDNGVIPGLKKDEPDIPYAIIGETKFFGNNSKEKPPVDQRLYTKTFKRKNARFIFIELGVKSKINGQTAAILFGYTFYRPDGSSFCNGKTPIPVEDDIDTIYASCLPPRNAPWESGTYTVVLTINSKEVAKDTFSIED